MIMKKLANIHPGEILDKEFLVPLNITAYRLSKEIKLPQTRISKKKITLANNNSGNDQMKGKSSNNFCSFCKSLRA